MKIVVTGGCGYIGSHVARAFKQHYPDCRMYVIDRERREHTLRGVDGFLNSDYASKQSLMWVKEIAPEIVVHCAGDILVGESVDNPAKYYDNNVAKTITFLSHIKNLKQLPLILFSSSASVYGNPTTTPVLESAPIQPISPYGISKSITERLLADYNGSYKLPSVCFRYFNACGAEPVHHDLGQAPGASHIIARVLEAKILGTAFTLNGNDYNTPDCTCIRDYVHVWDLADAHIRAAEWALGQNTRPAAVFNLGTRHGISNQEIIDYVQTKYGAFEIKLGARRAGDPDCLVADAELAHHVLQWKPNYSTIDQIVDSAWLWYNRDV